MKDSVQNFQMIVGGAAIVVAVVLVVKGFLKRRADRIMHEKVMRRLEEDIKRDGSEDA